MSEGTRFKSTREAQMCIGDQQTALGSSLHQYFCSKSRQVSKVGGGKGWPGQREKWNRGKIRGSSRCWSAPTQTHRGSFDWWSKESSSRPLLASQRRGIPPIPGDSTPQRLWQAKAMAAGLAINKALGRHPPVAALYLALPHSAHGQPRIWRRICNMQVVGSLAYVSFWDHKNSNIDL